MPALSSCGLKTKPRKSYRIEPYSRWSNYRSCNFNEEPCFLSVRNQPDIFPPMLKLIFALLFAQAPPATPAVVRKTVQITDGQTLTGRVLNEGMSDLQILTDDQRVHLLRKAPSDRYRPVTSQQDWPTYHGDPSGNRYTTLTQIDKENVFRLAPKWIFPLPNVTQVENTPVVVEGLMYVSSANEVWALDAGTGRQV